MISNPQNQIKPTLTVTVRSRNKVFYQGEANSVTSYNDKGIFDVLPLHANFISVINKEIKIIKSDNTSLDIKIDSGVIKVIANSVVIHCSESK